jgi:tRNA pseudouridine38-40 synthase
MSSLLKRSKILFQVAFDGSSFLGWQKTGSRRSVEDALEEALVQILQHPVQIEAASRLDRGVHARGQVVAFETARCPTHLMHRINCLLPSTIRVLKEDLVDPSFNPSLAVSKKEYRYFIDNGPIQSPFQRNYAWHIKEPLNLEAMRNAAQKLIGTHDFQVFCNQRKGLNYKDYIRTILEVCIEQNGSFIEIKMVGTHFLYKMCRNMVGLLVGYGKGCPMPSVEEILLHKLRPFVTAPACGLFLEHVFYDCFPTQ